VPRRWRRLTESNRSDGMEAVSIALICHRTALLLHADSPQFHGDFMADIDEAWSFASGVVEVHSPLGGPDWRAQIDVYLWAGRRS